MQAVKDQQTRDHAISGKSVEQSFARRASGGGDINDVSERGAVELQDGADQLVDPLPRGRTRHRAHFFEQTFDSLADLARALALRHRYASPAGLLPFSSPSGQGRED